jgi:hypothetical protein
MPHSYLRIIPNGLMKNMKNELLGRHRIFFKIRPGRVDFFSEIFRVGSNVGRILFKGSLKGSGFELKGKWASIFRGSGLDIKGGVGSS